MALRSRGSLHTVTTQALPIPTSARHRRDAGPRHRPPRAVRRQRRAGRLLLHPRLRLHRDRLPRSGDRHPGPRLACAAAGPDPARADRHADRRRRDRRAPQAPRRRGALRSRSACPTPPPPTSTRSGTAPAACETPYELTDEHGTVRLASVATYGETRHVFVRARRLHGRVPARLRGPGHRPHGSRRPAGRDRPRGRQRRARPHGRVGPLLRARVRDDRDDPLLRRGDLDRVLGADVQGRHRRLGADQVPDQRARPGQAQVPDRGVPGLLPRRRRPAHRRLDHRHRRER